MIHVGDCREILRTLPARSVQTCVTSPPYFGLRDYGHDGQIGLEPSPDEFVAALVEVFREVRRVLRDDGTVWLNLGDSYAGSAGSGPPSGSSTLRGNGHVGGGPKLAGLPNGRGVASTTRGPITSVPASAKPKDLIGIPWMVAFALRADGWYLRSDIIWAKPNPMPESVTDRPTKAHEYLFLLSKGPRYFYDADAIREDGVTYGRQGSERGDSTGEKNGSIDTRWHKAPADRYDIPGRNRRSVWTIATQPYSGAHFATFPPKLIEPCILAGTSPKACGECGAPWGRVVERGMSMWEERKAEGEPLRAGNVDGGRTSANSRLGGPRHNAWKAENPDRFLGWEPTCECGDTLRRNELISAPTKPCVVLDPFAGSGTTGVVAGQLQRDFVGIELNPEYAAMARERILVEGRPGQRNHEPTKVHEDQLGLIV